MRTKPSMHHTTKLVPCAMLAILLIQGVCLAQEADICNDPTLAEIAAVQRQVDRMMHVVSNPFKIRPSDQLIWLTGLPGDFSTQAVENILEWVAAGNVCWLDARMAETVGLGTSYGGSVKEALVAAGAADHPLVAGVKSVSAFDTFRYVVGVPNKAQPIMVEWNRADHVVLAVWHVGRGAVIIRPEVKANSTTWLRDVEKRWIEPHVADGQRLLHNINLYSLQVIAASHPTPPPAMKEEWKPKTLLEAFGWSGANGTVH